MRAIIESGGKQYPVAPGDRLVVERLHAEPGDQVELGRVLLIEDEGKVEVGQPTVPGAKVLAHVLEHDRGEKLVVFKFKAKSRYRRRTGHRQHRTVVQISEIVRQGEDGPQKRRRKLPERAR